MVVFLFIDGVAWARSSSRDRGKVDLGVVDAVETLVNTVVGKPG